MPKFRARVFREQYADVVVFAATEAEADQLVHRMDECHISWEWPEITVVTVERVEEKARA